MDVEQSKQIFLEVVLNILEEDWDPLDITHAPLVWSNYTSCVDAIYGLLESGESEQIIAVSLLNIETREWNLTGQPLAKLLSVAHSLRTIPVGACLTVLIDNKQTWDKLVVDEASGMHILEVTFPSAVAFVCQVARVLTPEQVETFRVEGQSMIDAMADEIRVVECARHTQRRQLHHVASHSKAYLAQHPMAPGLISPAEAAEYQKRHRHQFWQR